MTNCQTLILRILVSALLVLLPINLILAQSEVQGKVMEANGTPVMDAEVSVELDPRGLTYDHMQAFHQVGFNRCSMGIQDFDEKVQRAVNRNQSEELTRKVISWIRELEFESINAF